MKTRAWLVVVPTLLWLAALPAAGAESLLEVWRSPVGLTYAVALNPTDGSCWLGTGTSVTHFSPDGRVLSQATGFHTPASLSVNSADGSCWVGDTGQRPVGSVTFSGSAVVHLGANGAELRRLTGYQQVTSVSVNTSDGSCWVADAGNWDQVSRAEAGAAVVHLAADGSELWRGTDFTEPRSISVDAGTGLCWVANAYRDYQMILHGGVVVALREDGSVAIGPLWQWTGFTPLLLTTDRATGDCWVVGWQSSAYWLAHADSIGSVSALFAINGYPSGLSVNPSNGSCWVAAGMVQRIAPDGISTVTSFTDVNSLAVNPADGSCWLGRTGAVTHVSGDAAVLWEGRSLGAVMQASVNPTDGSCWTLSWGYSSTTSAGAALSHVSPDGETLWQQQGEFLSLGVYPPDGSCWATSSYPTKGVMRFAADGTLLWTGSGFDTPTLLAVDTADGSCWLADSGPGQIIHLALDGTELWRGDLGSGEIAVNPRDGSCWMIGKDGVTHLTAEGAALSATVVPDAFSLAVNPTDGSCWVGGAYSPGSAMPVVEVVHLAEDGSELWHSQAEHFFAFVGVNPADGSCWVSYADFDTREGRVSHLAADGSELSRDTFFARPLGLAVNTADGSCWVPDAAAGQLVHLVAGERGPFPDVPASFWAYREIMACFNANIVKGYGDGLYHPERQVTRDQMAVYISRVLVTPTGDAAIPDPTPPPHFSDVSADHWAYRHIEYAVSKNVVKGYDDGTYKPNLVVDRGQMAVFVARAMVTPSGDAGIPDPVPPATFLDVPESFWAYKQVEYCVDQGVVKGYDDGTYRPGDPVTRDQMAVYVARAFKLPL